MCISTAAKTLGVNPIKNLFATLSAHRWIFKRPNTSEWLAYQDKIQAGYLEHADHIYIYKDSQGQERRRARGSPQLWPRRHGRNLARQGRRAGRAGAIG